MVAKGEFPTEADEMAENDDSLVPEGETTKKKMGLPVILGAVAILAGGAFAVYFSGVPAKAQAMIAGILKEDPDAAARKKKIKPAEIVAMDPIIVSLPSDERVRRALPRLSIAVAVETREKLIVEKKLPQLRNDYIAAMREIDAPTLRSREGLDILRSSLTERTRRVLGEDFEQLLITEFIVL